MALFQKKPQTGTSSPLYTLGLQKTVMIVGLGNPGKEYDKTRHNIGFTVLDSLAERLDFPRWIEKKDLKSLLSSQVIGETRVILIKPTTFMNLSGEAVQAAQHFYKVPDAQILVVHDELDIPFGQIRSRLGGSDAGHNGIKSLIQHLGDNFGRIRIGIQNDIAKKADSTDFVLSKFTADEQKQILALLKETNAILSEYMHGQPLVSDTRSFII
jgi:PTH1 family peptidyl-tRNA hydrolase